MTLNPNAESCSRCGAELPPAARFCMMCGLPHAPLNELAERKVVTILFADVAGSTGLAERMDPEAWAAIMNRAFERLCPAVERYGGTIGRLMGDALLAFFGAPVAHEDDPVRATSAALELLEAAQAYADELRREQGIDFAIRIGLNTGPAVTGQVGSQEFSEYTAMGDAVNLAARVQTLARPMSVLLAEDTYRQVAGRFQCNDRGVIRVKGRLEPTHIYEVEHRLSETAAPRGSRFPGAGAANRIRSPLVGRRDELAVLEQCIEHLGTGQGGLVAVIGEAGLGKTRLLTEVRSRTAAHGVLWLEGQTLSFGQTISYWPFMEILRRWAGITDHDDGGAAWDQLRARVVPLFVDDWSYVLPYLALLLGIRLPHPFGERVEYLDSESIGRQIFRAVRLLFERMARQQPVALVVEDVHWLDESSADLLAHLLPLVNEVPLLIWAVSRPDFNTPAARLRELAETRYADRYKEFVLGPFTPEESDQHLSRLLPGFGSTSDIREIVLSKTEGNPFFAEEIVRSLIDRAVVVWDQAQSCWRGPTKPGEVSIPDTLNGVIAARLDRLQPDTKEALRTASVIGHNFLYRVLAEMTQTAHLDASLATLQSLDLIREKQRIPELEYQFKHALTHEVTYDGILLRNRRALHKRVGEAIESLYPDRLDEFCGMVAYHYARAEEWERAQSYLFRAGDQAGRRAADAEALKHYDRALRAYERAFGDRWDPIQRAMLERKLGEAYFRRGEHQRARTHLHAALSLLGYPYPSSTLRVRVRMARGLLRQLRRIVTPAVFAEKPARSIDSRSAELVAAYESLSWVDYWFDPEKLVLNVLEVLNVSERVGYAHGVLLGCFGMGLTCDLVPVFWLADRYHRRAIRLSDQLGNPVALGNAYLGLATHFFYRGDWEVAIAYFEKAGSALREVGQLRGWGASVGTTIFMRCLRGEFEEANHLARDLKSLGDEAADPQLIAWGESYHGIVAYYVGRDDESQRHLEQASELLESLPDYLVWVQASAYLASLYVRLRRPTDAVELLAKCRQVIQRQHLTGPIVSPALISLCEAYLDMAEAGPEDQRATSLRAAAKACDVALRHGSRFRDGLPGAYRARGTLQWLRGQHDAAEKSWRRSIEAAQDLGASYDLARGYLERGNRLGRQADVGTAEALFSKLGARLPTGASRAACPE